MASVNDDTDRERTTMSVTPFQLSSGKHQNDVARLNGMGYAQELKRSMSIFSNFSISFSIICILAGGINSFAQAITSVGGAGAGIGWPVGCCMSGVFALAMAQIASAFPTAGGLYHWASILGNPFLGFLTAWMYLMGLITGLGAANIGAAYFFAGSFGGMIGFTGTERQVVVFVAVITIAQALLNHLGIKITTMLTNVSGIIIFVTTAVLVVSCLVLAPAINISRLWTFTNYSGDAGGGVFPESESIGFLFLLSLLLPVYTITGYDASASVSEETMDSAVSVPKGIVTAVFWSSLVGWVMVCSITLAIPDMDVAASQGWGMFFFTMEAIMPSGLKFALYAGILIAQLLCGLATVTSASRMIFAFARDGGFSIGSKTLSTVSPQFRTPVAAIWTTMVLCILYVLLALNIKVGGTSIYVIVVNSRLVFLFLSFTIPLVAGVFAYGTERWPEPGPWAMSGGVYKLVSALTVVAMGVIMFIAMAPPNLQVLYVVLGFVVLLVILWLAVEKRRFGGPPIGDCIAARRSSIFAAEVAVGEKQALDETSAETTMDDTVREAVDKVGSTTTGVEKEGEHVPETERISTTCLMKLARFKVLDAPNVEEIDCGNVEWVSFDNDDDVIWPRSPSAEKAGEHVLLTEQISTTCLMKQAKFKVLDATNVEEIECGNVEWVSFDNDDVRWPRSHKRNKKEMDAIV